MKKLLALLLVLALTLSACLVLTACGDGDEGDTTADGTQNGGGDNNGGQNGGQNGAGDNNGGQNGGQNGGDNNGGQGGGQSSATVPGLNIPAGTYNATAGFSGALVLVNNYMYSIRLSGGYRIVTEMTFTVSGSDIVVTAVRMYTPDANAPQDMKDALAENTASIAGQVQTAPYSVEGNTLTYAGAAFAYASANVDPDAVALNAGGQGGGSLDQPVIIESLGAPQGTYSADDGFRQDVILTESYIYIVSGYSYGTLVVKYSYVYDATSGSIAITTVEAMTPDETPSASILDEVADTNAHDVGDTETYAFDVNGTTVFFDEYGFEYASASTTPVSIHTSGGGEGDGDVGGNTAYTPDEGMYYSEVSPNYRVKIEGKYLVLYRYFAEQTWIEIQYIHAFDDGVVELEFVKADYEGGLVDGVADAIDEIYDDYEKNKYDTWSYSVCEGGFIIDGSTFLSEMPNYGGGEGGGQGGGSSSGATLVNGKYYSVSYDDTYLIVDSDKLVYVKVFDDYDVGYVYSYVIEGNSIIVTGTDVILVSGDLTPDLQEAIDSKKPYFVGKTETMEFAPISDGYAIDGEDHVRTKPNYGEGGGSEVKTLKSGVYFDALDSSSYLLIANGVVSEVVIYDICVISCNFAYEIKDGKLSLSFLDAELLHGAETTEVQQAMQSLTESLSGQVISVDFYENDDGYNFDGDLFVKVRPEYDDGGKVGFLEDGKYYGVGNDGRFAIVEGAKFVMILRQADCLIGMEYLYTADESHLYMTFVDAYLYDGEPTPEIIEAIESLRELRVGTTQTIAYSVIDDGYTISGQDYVTTEPGGDDGEDGDIASGKYYNSDYEDLYAIVLGNRFTMVEVADGFELGIVFEYYIDGNLLNMTIVDVVVVSGTPDADALETVEQYRESMLGNNQKVIFNFIDDGFFLGGEDYTLTKPDYGEAGENIPNGLYCHDTYADEFMVEIYGEYYNEIIYFKDQGYVFTIYTYKLIDDVIELTFIDVEYHVENDSAKEFLESYAASRESTLSAMGPFTYRFEFVIDGFTLDGEATYLLQDVE